MKRYILFATASILLLTLNTVKAQRYNAYLALVNKRITFVDSLVSSFYGNPATSLDHTVTHYKCLGGDTIIIGGGSSDLYAEPNTLNFYQLTYNGRCDGFVTEKSFYFMNNKIVFIVISDEKGSHRETRTKYYRDDKLIVVNGLPATRRNKREDKDLKDGYSWLKRGRMK